MTDRSAEHAARLLERLAERIGVAVAWLGIPSMILLAALEPLARWVGWRADAPFNDASTVAFLATTMTSFGYAYAAGAHVRLEILSRRFPPRLNAAIELAGTLLILLPLCTVLVVDGVDSTWRSLVQGERWADTGLAWQWAVRLWVPLGFALLLAAGLASALRALLSLCRK
jgi:TRAP-type mannitol/chloroaromatic compound transport system permease small subunit